MRKAAIYSNEKLAGTLTETDEGKYVFEYQDDYLKDNQSRAISLTFPKRKEAYISDYLFPFFYNMLSEGANKASQCSTLKIDENDAFGLLLATAGHDTIGAITVKKL